jgi:hypothetical protein
VVLSGVKRSTDRGEARFGLTVLEPPLNQRGAKAQAGIRQRCRHWASAYELTWRRDRILRSMFDDFGNLGDGIGGFATAVLAVFAFMGGKSALHDWRERQQAEKRRADEQALQIRLDRERHHFGWTRGMHSIYGVSNVTDPDEMARAVEELAGNKPSEYAIIRVDQSVNRAYSLRQWIDNDGYLAHPPTDAEYEVLAATRPPARFE